jgi:hypothetical protein
MAPKSKAGPAKKKAAKSPDKKEQKTQRERFIETARDLGVDKTGKEFERLVRHIIPRKPSRS